MGKAARWLRGLLLGGKKPAAVAGSGEHPKPGKEKRGWGFGRSFRDVDHHRRGMGGDDMSVAVDEVRKGASYREVGPGSYGPSVASSRAARAARLPAAADEDEEQNKRAIAVAAATAAVAEAAVAAAQAAAAVVRLTSSGRCPALYGANGRKREEWAAVRVQAAFRGYLARRALRALRGLVKLQALVRGHIVRKQAAETLRCMQALVRVQARARACRALSENRRRNDGSRQTYLGPPTPQKFESPVRANYAKHDRRNNNVERGGNADDLIDPDRALSWKWLDRWMEERYWDSREATSWRAGAATDDEKNDKILEIDPGKPHSSHKRRANHHSSSTLTSGLNNARSCATVQDSPSKDSSFVQFSIPSPSSVDMQRPLSPLRFAPEGGEAYESPQIYSASSRPGSARRGPFTPAKSECSRSFFGGYSDYPNYMANTESSRAKLRSQSAPKQRPDYERLSVLRRVQVVSAGCGHSSSSSSQRSASLHLKFTSKDYPGSGRLDGMGMPVGY